jgi:hypothetical protein
VLLVTDLRKSGVVILTFVGRNLENEENMMGYEILLACSFYFSYEIMEGMGWRVKRG